MQWWQWALGLLEFATAFCLTDKPTRTRIFAWRPPEPRQSESVISAAVRSAITEAGKPPPDRSDIEFGTHVWRGKTAYWQEYGNPTYGKRVKGVGGWWF